MFRQPFALLISFPCTLVHHCTSSKVGNLDHILTIWKPMLTGVVKIRLAGATGAGIERAASMVYGKVGFDSACQLL
jgi:hypothetical protein